jgi:glycosyltransferase involved in cell wall biosynthesis
MNTVHLLVLNWGATGGIEALNKNIVSVFREKNYSVIVYSISSFKADRDIPVIDGLPLPKNRLTRYFWKRATWKNATAKAIATNYNQGDLIIFGHARLLSLIPLLEGYFITGKFWGWLYGIEIWGEHCMSHLSYLLSLERIVCISEYTAQHLRSAGVSKNIVIIPPCVDVSLFKPEADPTQINQHEILICGRISSAERYKGHDALLRALVKVEDKITLKVVGDGDDLPRLRHLAEELGVSGRVEFCGRLPFVDLVKSYQRCGVFCMPSFVEERADGKWTGEGFGIVYIEASASARPVIASVDGGAAETVLPGKTGLLVDPKSSDAIAQAIEQVVGDADYANRLGAEGRRWVEEKFSYLRFKERISNLLEE